MNLRLKLLSAFALLLLIFIMVAGLIFYASRAQQDASRAVEQSYTVVKDINEVLWHLSQMQTAFRSYMVTGDSIYLSSFQVASEQFDIAFDVYKNDVLLEPLQFGRMVSIEQDVRDWRSDILTPGIDVRRMANEGLAEPDAAVEFLQMISSQPGYQDPGCPASAERDCKGTRAGCCGRTSSGDDIHDRGTGDRGRPRCRACPAARA
jgi:CHASE3 domain sensor protein